MPAPGRHHGGAATARAAAVDVVVAHASAKPHAAQAAKETGWTAARAEQTKRARFRKDVNVNVNVNNLLAISI